MTRLFGHREGEPGTVARSLLWALVLVAVSIALGVLYYGLPRDRTIVLSGRSEAFRVTFTQHGHWRLEGVTVCLRRSRPTRSRGPGEEPAEKELCNSAIEEEIELGLAEFTWQPGVSLAIERRDKAALALRYLGSEGGAGSTAAQELPGFDRPLTPGSRVIVRSGPGGTGALGFAGYLVVGSDIGPGTATMLLEGDYEIHETLPLRSQPIRMRGGELLVGDRAEVVLRASGRAVPARGFLAVERGRRGARFVSVSQPERSVLRVVRIGTEPIELSARWSDRALADPVTLALTAIAGGLLILVNLVSGMLDLWRNRPAPAGAGGARLHRWRPSKRPPEDEPGRDPI